MSNKYPVYIVSKGRYKNPITASYFLRDKVPFKILVEPQEYDLYCKSVGKENVLELPFSDLGVGSYPARNFAWEHSIKNGHKRHWCFDDNIRGMRRLYKGKRIPCNSLSAIKVLEDFTDRYKNIGITAFNYTMFVPNNTKKPFYLNVHAYSAMLMKNDMSYRWRLKYNEDVDLCLQVLHPRKLCTVLFNAFCCEKISTTAKMAGGNQDELYKNNSHDKKVLKARSLEELWPQYVKTKIRFNRPHHEVIWKNFFKQPLIRDENFDWKSLNKVDERGFKLKKKSNIKSLAIKDVFNDFNKKGKNK